MHDILIEFTRMMSDPEIKCINFGGFGTEVLKWINNEKSGYDVLIS